MESDWVHEGFTIQILSNPMESEGIHEVLQSKPYQIQWNLMGFMPDGIYEVFRLKSYQTH